MTEETGNAARSQQIDENLKRVFQETLEQDVPERFRMLLDELRRRDPGGRDGQA